MSSDRGPSNSLVFNGGIEFRRLYKDLYPAATKWKKIGIELGCPPEQLDLIERKPSNRDDSDYLRDMLHYRQRRTEPSELTWEVIYRALLSSIVGESKLAKRIAWAHFLILINPRPACAARVTVVFLCVCLSVYDYSRTAGNEAAYERYQQL